MLSKEMLIEKRSMYKNTLESTLSDTHSAEIEEEVSKYRITLVEKYAALRKHDVEKIQSYLELLDTLIEEAEIEAEVPSDTDVDADATLVNNTVASEPATINTCW